MRNLLFFVQRNLFWLIVLAITLGLMNVYLFGGWPFSSFICVLAAMLMIFPSLVPLDFSELRNVKKRLSHLLLIVFINFIVLPLSAYLLGVTMLASLPVLRIGLMLIAILPGGGMITSWAMKSKSDMTVVIGGVFVSLLLGASLAPLYLSRLMISMTSGQTTNSCAVSSATNGILSCGSGGPFTFLRLATPLVVVIVIPAVLAFLTQRYLLSQDKRKEQEKLFSQFSNLGLIIVLFILMSMSSNKIFFTNSRIVFLAALPVISFYLLNFCLALLMQKVFKGGIGRALAWSVFIRYITLALGLATSLIFQDQQFSQIIIVIVLAYLVQIPLSFLLNKILIKNNQ